MDEEQNNRETHAAIDAALILADKLAAVSPDHKEVFNWAHSEAEKYGLWAEVCWSSNLREGMSHEEFAQALNIGMMEWDI